MSRGCRRTSGGSATRRPGSASSNPRWRPAVVGRPSYGRGVTIAQEQVRPGLQGWSRRTFSSLWVRNFRLFFVGQLISNTGNWLTIVALTLLVLHRTGSGLAVGGLAACQYGPILLLTAWAGLIADRSDKRHLLYVTQGLEMLQSAILAALAFLHDAPLPLFFVVAAAGGVLLAFDNPGRRS